MLVKSSLIWKWWDGNETIRFLKYLRSTHRREMSLILEQFKDQGFWWSCTISNKRSWSKITLYYFKDKSKPIKYLIREIICQRFMLVYKQQFDSLRFVGHSIYKSTFPWVLPLRWALPLPSITTPNPSNHPRTLTYESQLSKDCKPSLSKHYYPHTVPSLLTPSLSLNRYLSEVKWGNSKFQNRLRRASCDHGDNKLDGCS